MAKRPVIPMRIKLRTPTAGMDYDGSIHEGIEMAFLHLAPELRQATIAKLQAAHTRMLELEAKRS